MRKFEELTEEEWRIREVLTKIDNRCEIHSSVFDGVCYRCDLDRKIQFGKACKIHERNFRPDGLCQGCEAERQRKTLEGYSGFAGSAGRVDKGKVSVTEFNPALIPTLKAARERKKIETVVRDDKAAEILNLIVKTLGRKPYSNTTQDYGGRHYDYRQILWGVNLEEMVKISNTLASIGFEDFKISSHRWLSIRISKDLYVKDLLKKGK